MSLGAVQKYRVHWCGARGIKPPETVTNIDGKTVSFRRKKDGAKIQTTTSKTGRTRTFSASINGKMKHLGTSEGEAEARLREIVGGKGRRRQSLDQGALIGSLLRRGFAPETISPNQKSHPGISGFAFKDVVCVPVDFTGARDVPWAIGCLMLLRKLAGMPSARMVAVCFPDEGPAASLELADGFGVEFLTPEMLAESLAPEAAGQG